MVTRDSSESGGLLRTKVLFPTQRHTNQIIVVFGTTPLVLVVAYCCCTAAGAVHHRSVIYQLHIKNSILEGGFSVQVRAFTKCFAGVAYLVNRDPETIAGRKDISWMISILTWRTSRRFYW